MVQPTTCVKYDVLRGKLSNHPDKNFVNFVCNGLEFGFDTLVSSTTLPTKECNNLTSARIQPEIVSNILGEECETVNAYGPFLDAPFDCYQSQSCSNRDIFWQ